MTKPARAKLTIRTNATLGTAVVESAVVESPVVETLAVVPTVYARDRTEILFTATSALICHEGRAGDTEEGIAASVDSLLYEGAFAELRVTGVHMKNGDIVLDDATDMYMLTVDAALFAEIDAKAQDAFVPTPSIETIAAPVAEIETLAADPIVVPSVDAPEGEEVEIDVSSSANVFSKTKTGDACVTMRTPGMRTLMAFGPIAEALGDLGGLSLVRGIVAKGRSTDKIVALRMPGANDLIVELPKAA